MEANDKATPTPGFDAWLPVALLWLVALLNYLDRLLITSMREAIEASLPMTEAQFGLLTSVFLWAYALFSPVAGFLGDRYSRRWVIIFSVLVWSAFMWLTGHVHSYSSLVLARVGMGLSEACYLPTALALITDYHRGRTRSFATGLHITGLYAGIALGGIGGYAAQYLGWRTGFTALGIGGIFYAFVLVRFLHDSPQTPVRDIAPSLAPGVGFFGAVRDLFILPAFCLLIVLNVGASVSNWLIYGWLPTYLREHFSLGLGAAGLSATGYIQIASFVGVIIGGKWADHWAAKSRRGRMYVPAIGYLFAAPALFLMASTAAIAVAIGAIMLFGLGKGFYDANLMPMLREISAERHSATGYGILNCTGGLAGGIATYLGGVLRDHKGDLGDSFRYAAIGIFVAGLLLLLLRRGPRASDPPNLSASGA